MSVILPTMHGKGWPVILADLQLSSDGLKTGEVDGVSWSTIRNKRKE